MNLPGPIFSKKFKTDTLAFNKTFLEIVHIAEGSSVSLEIVWQGFCAMRTRLISFVVCGNICESLKCLEILGSDTLTLVNNDF